MRYQLQTAIGVFAWHLRRWRFVLGLVLWLSAMFCLATAAEGIHKIEWISYGAVPITLLTVGFVFPRRP